MTTRLITFPMRTTWLVERAWPPMVVWLPALLVGSAFAVPPIYLVVRASQSPVAAWEAVWSVTTLSLTMRTVALAASTTTLAVILALPLAWLTARTDLPGRRIWAILAALPLVIPSYIAAMLAISAFGPRGLLQNVFEPFGVERLPSIYGFWGATIVLGFFTYPYLLLMLRPALTGLDPRLEELSRGFGYGSWTTFWRVVLPQLRPALTAGGLLVALYAVSDFGAVSLLRYDSLTRALFVRYESGFDLSGAAALALVLIGVAFLLIAVQIWTRGDGRYHSPKGNTRSVVYTPLGRWRWPALLFVGFHLILALALPLGLLGYWFARGLASAEALDGVGASILDSLIAAGLAGLLAAFIALPIAVLSARYVRFFLTRPLELMSHSGFALPGLVVALALVFVALNGGHIGGLLYQTLPLLVVAYVLLFLPQALGASRTSLLQISPSMEEAAQGLGRRPWQVLGTVTLPLASRGVVAGAVLVFLTAMKELPATLILSPIGFDPLAVRVWSASSEAFFAQAALPALMLIVFSALPLVMLTLWRRDA
jgi:iron(III) transport system permease protein